VLGVRGEGAGGIERMNEMYYILGVLSVLFLIEKKAINILLTFVGLIVTIAITLPLINSYCISSNTSLQSISSPPATTPHPPFGRVGSNGFNSLIPLDTTHGLGGYMAGGLSSIEGEYYSYILILVEVSALTILFGFIIMLFPTLSISQPQPPHQYNRWFKIYIILSIVVVVLYLTQPYEIIPFELNNIFSKYEYVINSLEDTGVGVRWEGGKEDSKFIRNLGKNLYNNDNDIIKLLLLTFILLLAIVSLFFLLPV
jgi:hypothetical protein